MGSLWSEGIGTYSIIAIALIALLFIMYLAVRLKRKKRFDVAKISLKDIDQMTGHEFEEYLFVLFVAMGYEQTYLTKKSGDYGADLLFVDEEGRKTVIQAKRLTHLLSLNAVQEVYAAQAYYEAERALIVTSTSKITKPCQKLASATGVRIIDRDELGEIILLFKKGKESYAKDMIEEPDEFVSYNSSHSLETIQQSRGIVRAGEYFYRK